MDPKTTATATVARASISGPVHISVPASVAFNLDKMATVLKNIGDRLGCSPCISGADCFLKFERDWLVDPATLGLQSTGIVRE